MELYSHRMAWVEKDLKDHLFSVPLAMCRVSNHQTRLPRATSSLALNASRDGASTASLGNLLTNHLDGVLRNMILQLVVGVRVAWLG